MLKSPFKVDNKIILIAPFVLGVYLIILFLFHAAILEFISLRLGLGIAITNEYPVLTFILFYLSSAPLAMGLCTLLLKRRLKYDDALLAGLACNFTINIILSIAFLFAAEEKSMFAFVGLLFFLSIIGFALTAISAVFIDKLCSTNFKLFFK